MSDTASLSAILNDWLSSWAAAREGALRQAAKRFATLVSPTAELETTPAAPESGAPVAILSVSFGLHRGASMELTGQEYLVGSGDDCDIVLRDKQVAAHHCRITREWPGFTVRNEQGGKRQIVTPSKVTYENGATAAEYDIDSVLFTLKHPSAARDSEAPRDGRSGRHSVAVLFIVIASGALAAATLGAAGHTVGAAATGSSKKGATAKPALAPQELLERARRALANESLRVDLRDGGLVIEGRTAQQAIKGRIQALTQDLRGTVTVQDHVDYVDAESASAGALPVTVTSVLVGNPSYFLTDTGARYFVGATLPDGTEVVSVDQDEIRFRRGGRILAYKLQ
jgi:hypothetical protein